MRRFRQTPYLVATSGEVYREGKDTPLKPDVAGKGYRRVTLSIDGKTERFLLHRLVAEAYLPMEEGRPYVNHKDNDPSNNRVSNLEWCTHSENMMHSHKQGRCANIVASQQASAMKMVETAKAFQQKLGDHFIDVVNKNPRNYVRFQCAGCLKEMLCRTDSSVFNQPVVVCRSCLYKMKI